MYVFDIYHVYFLSFRYFVTVAYRTLKTNNKYPVLGSNDSISDHVTLKTDIVFSSQYCLKDLQWV